MLPAVSRATYRDHCVRGQYHIVGNIYGVFYFCNSVVFISDRRN